MRQSSASAIRHLTQMRFAAGAAVVLVVGSLLIVGGGGGDSGPTVWNVVAITIAALVALGVLVSVLMQLAGVDADATEIAGRLAHDPDQQRLLVRWLERARWARFVGGLCGLLVWFFATRVEGDVLLYGTGGIAVGAVLAEMHHLRRPSGPRTARLEVRTVGDYLMPDDARRMIGVALVAVVVGAVGAASNDTRHAVWWGLAALAVLCAAHLAQRRVATRPRPAVSDSIRRADDLARQLAIGRGLARPATFVALAMVARGWFALEPSLDGLAVGLGIAAWLYGALLWWLNRRLGLDFLLTDRPEPVLA